MTDPGVAPAQQRWAALAWHCAPVGLALFALTAWTARILATERVLPPLHAATGSGTPGGDLDGDGLDDALEHRLGTDAGSYDTDRDGFSDSEEIARGSSPLHAGSLPGPDPVSLSLEAYQSGGPLKLVTVLYAADGDPASKALGMGARVGTGVRKTPLSFFLQKATTVSLKGAESGSSVLVIDAPVDPLLVYRFGSLSFFTTVSNAGKVVDAGVVNVAWKEGILLEYVTEPYPGPAPARLAGEPQATGHYEPIDPGSVPKDWIPDQICYQIMTVAASVGPVVIQEVVEAQCEEGWDAFCDPACPATVGTTVESLDPGALIGG